MKILIADNHTLFRDILEFYLIQTKEASDVRLARDLHESMGVLESDFKADLVLLDMYMPGMNGIKGLVKMLKRYPDVNIALLSGVATQQDVDVAMKAGARGFFPKTISAKAFVKGLRDIISGAVFMPVDHNTDQVMPSYFGDNPREVGGLSDMQNESFRGVLPSGADLTPREKDVLMLLMKGASNKEIAKELNVQVVTVKLHVGSLFRKFDVKNRTQVVLKAQSMGFGAAAA